MGSSRRTKGRPRTPQGRARLARRAFVATLLSIGEKVILGKKVGPSDFREDLLSVITTAECVRSYGTMNPRPHQNLLERDLDAFVVLERLVTADLRSKTPPQIIWRHLRGKARELEIAI